MFDRQEIGGGQFTLLMDYKATTPAVVSEMFVNKTRFERRVVLFPACTTTTTKNRGHRQAGEKSDALGIEVMRDVTTRVIGHRSANNNRAESEYLPHRFRD